MDKSQLQPSPSRLLLEYFIYTWSDWNVYCLYVISGPHAGWVVTRLGFVFFGSKDNIWSGYFTANVTLKLILLNCSAELLYQTIIAFIYETTATIRLSNISQSVIDSIYNIFMGEICKVYCRSIEKNLYMIFLDEPFFKDGFLLWTGPFLWWSAEESLQKS